MSLESKIETLTAAVEALTAKFAAVPVAPSVAPPTAPAMPAPPSFLTNPAPVAPAVAAPFTDQQGLMTYIMDAYNNLGQVKGAAIQTVLTGLGCGNVSDLKPEQYGAFYAGVEALKAQA